MGKATVAVKLEGLKQVQRTLKGLGGAVQRKIVRAGMNKATQPLAKDIKARLRAHRRYGLLQRSIGRRVKTTRRKTIAGVVGPRTGYRTQVGTTQDGDPIYANPTQYYHLLEFGTQHSAAHPTLRPAWAAGKTQAAATLAKVCQEQLAKEVAKLRGRS